MRWWGKVIGGTVGLTVGGPPGAVIGAGLGAVADHALDDPPDFADGDLDAEGRFIDDDMGRFSEIVFRTALPAGAIAVAQIETRRGRVLRPDPTFSPLDKLSIRQPIQRGKVAFYIPFSALQYRFKGAYVLRVWVRWSAPGNPGVQDIGQAAFAFSLPRAKAWHKVELVQPLIALCSTVAHADGPPSGAVKPLIETFFLESLDVPAQQTAKLSNALNTPPEHDLQTLAQRTMRRLPELRPMTILALLAEVARAGSAPTRRERTVIRDVSEHLGIPSHRWPEVRDRLRLVVHNPWAILDIDPGAPEREIKRAYRAKLKGLHPDRVAGLDLEIQDLAEARTIELREAYEACLDATT